MVSKELFDRALCAVEKVYKLSAKMHKETKSDRFIALNELARKMRTALNAIYFIPYEQYDVMYPSVNLLYRGLITDLMTSLILLLVTEEQFNDFLLIDNLKFVDSLRSALNTEIEVRKHFNPQNDKEYDKLKLQYQIDHYNELKDCLDSIEGAPWILKKTSAIDINGQLYTGQIKEMYEILKSSEELYCYALLYKYYRLFSQSEHFSMKGRFMNHKQDIHDKYYNEVLDFIHTGEKLIYDKYKN